jgi:hypothetical protein
VDAVVTNVISSGIYRAGVPDELEDALLELQDVFFLFWKAVPCKRYYQDRLLALWERVCGGEKWAGPAFAGPVAYGQYGQ